MLRIDMKALVGFLVEYNLHLLLVGVSQISTFDCLDPSRVVKCLLPFLSASSRPVCQSFSFGLMIINLCRDLYLF